MSTSAQIIAAARDEDLKMRLVALAAAEGIQAPQQWVELHLHELVAIDFNSPEVEGDDSIASVYEYAVLTYNPTPRPGVNPAAVTDDHIRAAIQQVKTEKL